MYAVSSTQYHHVNEVTHLVGRYIVVGGVMHSKWAFHQNASWIKIIDGEQNYRHVDTVVVLFIKDEWRMLAIECYVFATDTESDIVHIQMWILNIEHSMWVLNTLGRTKIKSVNGLKFIWLMNLLKAKICRWNLNMALTHSISKTMNNANALHTMNDEANWWFKYYSFGTFSRLKSENTRTAWPDWWLSLIISCCWKEYFAMPQLKSISWD